MNRKRRLATLWGETTDGNLVTNFAQTTSTYVHHKAKPARLTVTHPVTKIVIKSNQKGHTRTISTISVSLQAGEALSVTVMEPEVVDLSTNELRKYECGR